MIQAPSSEPQRSGATSLSRIVGGGALADLIRNYEWARTPLGPIHAWPDPLLCAVNQLLACGFPSLIFWGPEMIQFYNDAFRPLLSDRHPGIGQPAREFWHDVWSIVGAQLHSVLDTGESVVREQVLVPIERHGRREDVYWNYSYSPIFSPGGDVNGILVVCQDITKELVAKRELRASEDRQSRTLASLLHSEDRLRVALAATQGLGIFDWDVPNDRFYADTAFAQSYGVDPHAAQSGLPIEEYIRNIHPDDLGRVRRRMDRALADGKDFSCEYRLHQPDGSFRWVLAVGRCHQAPDGKPLRFPGVTIDITDRKRMEEALRESEDRFEAIYSTSVEYIGILDPKGTVLDCNRAALAFAGSTREEVIGIPFWDGPWFANTPGTSEIVRGAVARAAAGERQRSQLPLFRPSGELITFDFSLSPAFDENGEVIFLVPEGRDINELKRAETALLQSEKLAAVGRLASSIAHEINNPLEAITNLLFLARQHAILPIVKQYLDQADEELRRVTVIANQTLRFHRQASNPRAARPEELFATVLTIFEGKLKNAHIGVEVRHRATRPVVCFEGDVRQVLNNLVGNAVDAIISAQTEGRLMIRSREGIHWPTQRKGLIMTVADNGTGMPEEVARRIFEPFFTTKGIGGTGLGLWISKEVASRHQGALKLRSSQRPGRACTVFQFFLPHAAEPYGPATD